MKLSASLRAFIGAAFTVCLAAQNSYAIKIIHSNDVLGELDPCGCRTNPLGGYPRKESLLKALPNTFPSEAIIQVDAGDLLYPSNVVPDLLKAQSELQAQYVIKTLELLHHDIVVPGEKDFALGTKSFLNLIHGSNIHFLAANLNRKNGKPILPGSVILTRKNRDGKTIRVAVLGLVGKDLEWPSDLKIGDPIATAEKQVPLLRAKSDFVIVVSHQGLEEDQRLAKKVHGIDYIFGGHTQSFLQTPVVVGSTTIFQSSFRNQYVGILNLPAHKGETVTDDNYKLIGLDAGLDSPADKPSPIDEIVKKFKIAVALLNSQTQDQVNPSAATGIKFQTFPRCAECHLKQFEFWRRTPHMNALNALVTAHQDKNKDCLSCHTVGLGDPLGVSNVNQLVKLKTQDDGPANYISSEQFVGYLKSLHDAKSLNDQISSPMSLATIAPAPVPTGSPAPQGLLFEKTVSVRNSLSQIQNAWTPVQCENCHSPGVDHPFGSQGSIGVHKTVENTVCMSCHTQARAPEWYSKDGKPDWDKIRVKHAQMACPTGDLNPEN